MYDSSTRYWRAVANDSFKLRQVVSQYIENPLSPDRVVTYDDAAFDWRLDASFQAQVRHFAFGVPVCYFMP